MEMVITDYLIQPISLFRLLNWQIPHLLAILRP